MAAQAPKVISSSGNEKVSQWQGLAPAQPMQKVAQHLAPDGHFEKAQERSDLLQKLGVSRKVTPREEVERKPPASIYTHPKIKTSTRGGWCFVGCEQGPGYQANRARTGWMPQLGF